MHLSSSLRIHLLISREMIYDYSGKDYCRYNNNGNSFPNTSNANPWFITWPKWKKKNCRFIILVRKFSWKSLQIYRMMHIFPQNSQQYRIEWFSQPDSSYINICIQLNFLS